MSAKILSSLTDENRHHRKQSGCINGIFQLFDPHHSVAGRRVGSQNHKRLLTGAQHQLEPLKEKHLEAQKEKSRLSTESPRASYSSSSCSSTFSSLDKNRKSKPINGRQSSDIRDVVKDSMSIKLLTEDVRKVTVIKHIDSPRPRFSYDGRESRDEKLKELPRLSLESRLAFLGRTPPAESQPGSHTRSSSIVAKLMGLENFPETSPKVAFPSKSSRKAEEIKQNQASQKNSTMSASPRLCNADHSVKKPAISSKMAEKASENTCSAYGEIEKRIAELEFKGSGKDLRALKQILESMQKTKQRMENKLMQERKSSSIEIKKPKSTNMTGKAQASHSTHLPRLQSQSQETKYRAHREKTEDLKPKKEQSCRKKGRENGPKNRKQRVKSKDLPLSEESESCCYVDTASVKSESSKSVVSYIETEAIRSVNLIKTNCREQQNKDSISNKRTSAAEMEVTMMEQPSPVSVLDATFYSEDSPSPVKKKSTVFQDEAEWHLENLNHSTECRKSDTCHKHNQKPENIFHLRHEPRMLEGKPNESSAEHIESFHQSVNPDHRCINKIYENLTENYDKMRLNQKIQRKIVFDMPYRNTNDEDDGFARLLAADMKNESDDWTNYSGEIPALVLDIERLIFKDLITEVVALRDWPKAQLFIK